MACPASPEPLGMVARRRGGPVSVAPPRRAGRSCRMPSLGETLAARSVRLARQPGVGRRCNRPARCKRVASPRFPTGAQIRNRARHAAVLNGYQSGRPFGGHRSHPICAVLSAFEQGDRIAVESDAPEATDGKTGGKTGSTTAPASYAIPGSVVAGVVHSPRQPWPNPPVAVERGVWSGGPDTIDSSRRA